MMSFQFWLCKIHGFHPSLLEGKLDEISRGGEAVVLKERIEDVEYAVRVACFDSALFAGDTKDYSYEWHLSEGRISRLLGREGCVTVTELIIYAST